MTSYKDFPPGWNHILVPVGSRAGARIGLAMYTPCRRRGEMLQDAAWALVNAFGPAALPGRRRSWAPPMDTGSWEALLGEVRDAVGSFDGHAVYERREGRPGVLLVLIRDDTPLGFAKIRFGDDTADGDIAAEAAALRRAEAAAPSSFSVPRMLATGAVAGWSYAVTTPMPPGRHRMPKAPNLVAVGADIESMFAGAERPEDIPAHWAPMHGDLTPWNLRTVAGETWLIDWETSGWGPPGADEALYRANAGALGRPVQGPDSRDLGEAAAYWIERISTRRARRRADDEPDPPVEATTLEALRAMAGAAP